MHVLPKNDHFQALSPGEKMFIEAWYNLTHERSLDSFRVRCHNGRTILEELKRESAFSFASTEDIATIAAEAEEICTRDPILTKLFGPSWEVLVSLLTTIAAKNAKDDSTRERTNLDYLLTDTLASVAQPYLAETIANLQAAITANQASEIIRLTNSLATDLTARGWAVAGLHTWIATHFLAGEWAGGQFDKRFSLFANRVKQPPQTYHAVLSLSGSDKLQKLGTFGDFTFSVNPPAVTPEAPKIVHGLENFLRKNPQRTFASTTVEAVDPQSAVHAAQEKFAKCQDRLRFNFCPEPVIGRRPVLVTRQADNKQRVLQAEFRIPSPEHHQELPEFLLTNRKLDDLIKSGQISNEARRRIEASVRHYRLGLDGRTYRDMLLNWWMGLETLTNAGDGKGIGAKVVKHSLPLLTHRYFDMQLRHLFVVALSACGKWPEPVLPIIGEAAPKNLSLNLRLSLLQNAAANAAVLTVLNDHPWVRFRWERFQQLATDPAKLAAHLDEHEQRVRWQLLRLYRIRCCLVHGTPIDMPLQLPTANLEYYLREAIYVVLGALLNANQISSLESVFDRAQFCATRRKLILSAKGNKPEYISAALSSDIVFQLATS